MGVLRFVGVFVTCGRLWRKPPQDYIDRAFIDRAASPTFHALVRVMLFIGRRLYSSEGSSTPVVAEHDVSIHAHDEPYQRSSNGNSQFGRQTQPI